jgi:hypothetical protein
MQLLFLPFSNKLKLPRNVITSEQIAARGSKSVSYLRRLAVRRSPPAPPAAAAPSRGTEHRRLFSQHRAPTPTQPGDPNRQARSSLAQRETAAEHRGRSPQSPEEGMKRVAAARTTGCCRCPYQAPLSSHAASSRAHTCLGPARPGDRRYG